MYESIGQQHVQGKRGGKKQQLSLGQDRKIKMWPLYGII